MNMERMALLDPSGAENDVTFPVLRKFKPDIAPFQVGTSLISSAPGQAWTWTVLRAVFFSKRKRMPSARGSPMGDQPVSGLPSSSAAAFSPEVGVSAASVIVSGAAAVAIRAA